MFTICGLANSGVPRIIIRPITLVSIPEPDLSLPMASMTRTSAASNGRDGASRFASARRAASAGPPISDGSRNAIRAARSWPSSTMPRPPSRWPDAAMTAAARGTQCPSRAGPNEWIASAPERFPRPIATILARPLSTVPLKSVWALIRLIGEDPVGLGRVPVEVDRRTAVELAKNDRLHRRQDRHPHRRLGDARGRRGPRPGPRPSRRRASPSPGR